MESPRKKVDVKKLIAKQKEKNCNLYCVGHTKKVIVLNGVFSIKDLICLKLVRWVN